MIPSISNVTETNRTFAFTAKEVYAAAGTSLSRCLSLSQGIEVPFPLHYFIRLR